jgi:hypothetical protein
MPIIQQLLMDPCYYDAIQHCSAFDDETEVHTMNLPRNVYKSLVGHSDIFACSLGSVLVVEPSVYENLCLKGATRIIKGESCIGDVYPHTAHYNALATDSVLLHNEKVTDKTLMSVAGKRDFIQVSQGYARCTTFEIAPNEFITSDQGVFEVLKQRHIHVEFIPSQSIHLSGQTHGFIGGCCGYDRKGRLWLYGSLKYHPFCDTINRILDDKKIECIELLDAPLRDIGGLLFWDK